MSFSLASRTALVSTLGALGSSSFGIGFRGGGGGACARNERASTAKGTPTAQSATTKLRLEFIIGPPESAQLPRAVRRRFIKPLPMLYSLSQRDHVQFLKSLAGVDAPQRPPSNWHPRYCAGVESAPSR